MLEGKLSREEEDMEDLLTSNVFGALSYVDPEKGLALFLANSEDINGNPPPIKLKNILNVEYSFWPRAAEEGCMGCEPNVQVKIQLSEGKKIILFVESKYFSDKSSEADSQEKAPSDQLAKEYDNLQGLSTRENAEPVFLFATADLSFPKQSFIDSNNDYTRHKGKSMEMYWISWRKLPTIFSDRRPDNLKRDILSDLVQVLKKQGLIFYEGITVPRGCQPIWSFKATVSWNWSIFQAVSLSWKYQPSKKYNWQFKPMHFNWRFGDEQ